MSVELDYAVALWVCDGISEDSRSRGVSGGIAERLREVVAVEDVVAKYKAAAFACEELFADQEGLRQAVGRRLDCVLNTSFPISVRHPSKLLEARRIGGSGDDEDVADTRQHQHREVDSRSSACRRPVRSCFETAWVTG